MEAFGMNDSFPDGDQWDFIAAMFSSDQDNPVMDFTPHFLGQQTTSTPILHDDYIRDQFGETANLVNDHWFYSLDTFNTNDLHCIEQGADHDHYSQAVEIDNDVLIDSMSMNNIINGGMSADENINTMMSGPFVNPAFTDIITDIENCSWQAGGFNDITLPTALTVPGKDISHLKRKLDASMSDNQIEIKKTRVSRNKKRTGATAESKKRRKSTSEGKSFNNINEEEGKAGSHQQGQINCISSTNSGSDRDNVASEENIINGSSVSRNCASAALNLTGKLRATRGSATDPQSLYARKRREKINDRLRILQKLIPNGTKVDISTMLEEAVRYVRFLQVQIKLLSSDELWMYAPLAYNGMDIGLHHNISPYYNLGHDHEDN